MLKSTLNYGAATWAPNVSETNWKKLEARQNDGLRAVTGCLKMSPVDHIRTETMCIPIKENCNMIACQFAAEALQNPGHPCHEETKKDSSTRQVRKSLREHHKQHCQKLLLEPTCKKEEIHRETVKHVVQNLADNKVLNDSPPVTPDVLIENERELTRKDEVTLCQLRSGYSSKLNSYISRIDDSKSGLCRKCKKEQETVSHMVRFHLNRKPGDLWTDPVAVSKDLDTL